MAVISPPPKLQFFDSSGAPLVGGRLYTYRAGTSTPQATFTDSTAATQNTNPIILDARGECSVWLNGSSYKFVLRTPADAFVWTQDQIGDARGADLVSVQDHGATGAGDADDTLFFSAAAKAAPAAVNIVGAEAALPRAPMCVVCVPAGSYVLTSEVDTGGREVTWDVDPAAVIAGYGFLNGKVLRKGQHQNDAHHGTTDYACSYSFRSNTSLDDGAEVLGITSASQLATYTDRDTVGLYVDNWAPAALVDAASAIYTSTTVTFSAPSAANLRRYRRGMIIDTKHATKFSGIVDSWNADGSVVTVTGWYLAGGGGAATTPTNDGTGCYVNVFTKVWAHNANVFLPANAAASGACGFELGMFNSKGNSDPEIMVATNRCWGFDSVNLGTYQGHAAFVARGPWRHAFFADGQEKGFSYKGVGVGFYYKGAGIGFNFEDLNGVRFASLENDGTLNLGSLGSAATRSIDLHSSGNVNDYDSRILFSGGTATLGEGEIRLVGGRITLAATEVIPFGDNSIPLGKVGNRWSVLYAGTGTINTSDARMKVDVSDLSAAEKRTAVRIKTLIKKFRFADAVEKKGAEARIHIGVLAQEVKAAFEAEGLVAERYGLFCYDEWEETMEVLGPEGEVVTPHTPAGNRYGIRYEELLAFVVAAL